MVRFLKMALGEVFISDPACQPGLRSNPDPWSTIETCERVGHVAIFAVVVDR
jgi:hypothetical protein